MLKLSHICAGSLLASLGLSSHAQVPFAAKQDWRGSFVCPTGNIAAKLYVDSVEKQGKSGEGRTLVRGVFTFGGSEKLPPVSHHVTADYSPGKSLVKFTPGKWVIYPDGPVPPAGFSGTVSEGGDLFNGQMAYGKCEALTLKRAASAAQL